ncbi:hypothetical protein DOTSEDRAFT_147557 [Dothistroma septosporum NZE10]|uniref:Elongation of fatty acids protein n=1 Tax=Dothistroma septosporum (strain NZE10 / CBS 128990) TaxID=675120 RepID=N1PZ21_DOTSN|nr:hypothetical protein DOTSEDRAFT_147557 [Dothistroma septosporum NZE10]
MAQGSGPQVYITKPVFAFTWNSLFPEDLPKALPPPIKERTFRAPFGIDKDLYNFALQPWIPFTFAAVYIVAVFSLNAYNRKQGNKPWTISRSPLFKYFVILHNALLTIYSAATFLAMCRAILHTWPEGGFSNPSGLAGIADSLCKIHGPRGIGDAATYNTTINIWEAKNTAIHLGYDSMPDPTDVGRLWNEGLAFWGWWFYVSKFYEVVDTMIIIAKGKRSATLQTYHHSGAMLCMWAGIRYMSPPIWMFVFVNSFIHALMYTYFTLSALGIRINPTIKRTLTTMQIAQFLWGASYAAAHLFIQYDIPIATPYQIASTIQAAAANVSSAASATASTISKVIESPAATGTLVALAKKLLLRAVGAEGIAELVTDDRGGHITPHIEEKIEQFNERSHAPQYETRWRTEWTKNNCIDTSGEAFAIYLNLFYLAPLTWLFARFFVKAYTGRGKPRRASHAAKQVADAGRTAAERTDETVEKLGRKAEDGIIEAQAKAKNVDVNQVHDQLRRDLKAVKEGTFRDRRVSDHVQNFEDKAKTAAEKVAQNVKDGVEKAKQEAKKVTNGTGSPGPGSPTKRNQATPRSGSPAKKNGAAPRTPSPTKRSQETLKHSSSSYDETSSRTQTSSSTTTSKKGGSVKGNNNAGNGGDSKKQQAAQEAKNNPSTTSESTARQDEILDQSEPARNNEIEGREDKENRPTSSGGGISAQLHEGLSYSDAVKDGADFVDDDGKDFPAGSESKNESASKQEENLTQSQSTRPNPSDSVASIASDTDAMGKSGYSVEKPTEARNNKPPFVVSGRSS